DRVIDLGTGCGIIPLILAKSTEVKKIIGVEIQEELADIALRNVRLNELSDTIIIQKEDLKNISSFYPPDSFNWVLTNPPFRELDTGRLNPQEQKAVARHEIAVSLKDLLKVYPAFRLVDLFYEMRKCYLEPKTIQFVHSRLDAPARMVLVEGVREGGVELQVKEPLIIHDSGGNYTESLQKIYSFSR
ncbi:MAG: methyltransferase, partial [Deltaproteobacteria bacterium]|nr:methyltransferase [Deltaproteobacteria bacterium]